MLKKSKVLIAIMVAILFAVPFIGCVDTTENSVHEHWYMRLCNEHKNLIYVHRLTGAGEQYARENDGVLTFPATVDGRSEFNILPTRFRLSTGGDSENWSYFALVNEILFEEGFQGYNLRFWNVPTQPPHERITFSMTFSGRQEQLFSMERAGVFAQNENRGRVTFMQNTLDEFYDDIMEIYGFIPSNYIFLGQDGGL